MTSLAARVTPAVTAAQGALADAIGARDRESRSGTGKHCRERESEVVEARHALDVAMSAVASTSAPQSDAAVRMAAWITGGVLKPTGHDLPGASRVGEPISPAAFVAQPAKTTTMTEPHVVSRMFEIG